MSESIYSLGFVAQLTREGMDKLALVSDDSKIEEGSRPTSLQRSETFVVALFCAFTQSFISLLLFRDFVGENQD